MQRLIIDNIGPIKKCDIEINDYMVFTGPQASGKSTVAKSIFYFNHLKDILFLTVQRECINKEAVSLEFLESKFRDNAISDLRQSFGFFLANQNESNIQFFYDNGAWVSVKGVNHGLIQLVGMEYSDSVRKGLKLLVDLLNEKLSIDSQKISKVIQEEIFANSMEVVYIPAGRSLITVLNSQISYLYSVMDDRQKKSIDYCTKNFLERILQIKPSFEDGLRKMVQGAQKSDVREHDGQVFEIALELMQKVLKGEYRCENGQDQLLLEGDKQVLLNYASSGQQEAVWIINVLLYYMMDDRKAYFIIEEPESHLFPDAQKAITEFITLAKNGRNKVVLTTHSPYVLGSINNLLYANRVSREVDEEKLQKILSKHLWLNFETLSAYFLENGAMRDITDSEFEDIDHDVIDGASADINETYEAMVALRHGEEN